jgi:ribosomal protein S18 acetylase RimI-like enzyme
MRSAGRSDRSRAACCISQVVNAHVFNFQLRPATQHDFATIIRFVQNLLSEMELLSQRELTDQAEAWLDFDSRILQTLSCDENGDHTYPSAVGRYIAHHLLEIAETIDDAASPIGLIEASILQPVPIFRSVQTLYIHALYVLPSCRCQGVGTALLRAALDWGRQHHCLQATLCTLPHNPARRLYQKLGFTVDGLAMRKVMTSVS